MHRLEAFSDIVIGFSLAQITYNLVVPADARELFTKSSLSLVAFGLTFFIISAMWWAHHRLFVHYFVPTRINIVLNFASLGGVTFLVYSLQVWLKARFDLGIAYAMYCGSLAWVTGTIAVLTYRGVVLRGTRMSRELAARGRWRALRMGIIAAALGTSAVIDAVRGTVDEVLNSVVIVTVLLLALARVLEARVSRRETRP